MRRAREYERLQEEHRRTREEWERRHARYRLPVQETPGKTPWQDNLGSGSLDNLRRRYKALALKHHPDKGGDAAAFRRVHEAWKQAQAHYGR